MKHPKLLCLLILPAFVALKPGATLAGEWTGTGPSLNWSEPNNWDPATTPTSASYLYFSDIFYQSAYTNAAGLVNNIVDTSYTAGGINFNTLSGSTAGNHHYTTLIPAGMTLTIDGGTPGPIGEPAFLVGNFLQTSGSLTNYTTITGEGNLAVQGSASVINVRQVSRATLDLSGLNTFNANVASFFAGVPQFDSTATFVGNVLLAKTNTITTTAGLNAPGILLGSANTGTGTAFLGLGKVNAFNTDALVVGGLRAGFGTILNFGPGNSNSVPVSTFTLRGSAGGATPIPLFTVGDLSANYDSFTTNRTGSSSTSSADFSGGVVDILADKIYVGRSANNEVAVSSSASTGNLIVEQGTVTATNVYIAHKVTATNNTAGQGTLILRSSALMTVYEDLSLCFRTNGTAFINAAGLQVRDAAVLSVGGNITSTQTGSGTPAAISLAGGTINLTGGGSVFTPALNGFGTIAGASNITVTNALSVGDNQSVGTLTLSDNLTLANPFALTFNLGASTTVGSGVNDYLDVANNVSFNNNPITLTYGAPLVVGTYKLIGYGGTQSGAVTWVNPTRSPIGLVQGAGQVAIVVTNLTPASLTWRAAGAGANWEATSLNWNNNTEKFYTFDNVVFDDTGVATNVTIAAITNLPGNVTFNNTIKTYTLTQSGSGAIGGYAALDKNGTGLLIMGGGGANNYFTGPVNINAGTIRIGSFNSGVFGTTASTTPINIAAGATLDSFGNGYGSSGSYGRPINVAGTGVGGNGAIVHLNAAGSANPTITTAGLTLAGDALLAVTGTKALNFSGVFAPYSGVLDLGDLAYFLAMTLVFLTLNTLWLEGRKY